MYIRKLYSILIGVFALFILCTFDDNSKEPLTMTRVDEGGDTVSLWPQLTFIFSVPVQDSTVSLKLEPYPGTVYHSILNGSADTLVLSVSGALKAKTTYQVVPAHQVTAENGSILYPEDVTFKITTHPGEFEPNNDSLHADTLLSVSFGTVFPINDTDYFYVNNAVATRFYHRCHKNKSGFFIIESTGKTVAVENGLDDVKTFTISDTVTMPLFVGVFSTKDNDARYEISLE